MEKTSAKVTLTREVAEAIEQERKQGHAIAYIFTDVYEGKSSRVLNLYFPRIQSFDVLMQALVSGYEVEKTPEDKILESYRSHSEIVLFYSRRNHRRLDISEREQERYSSGYVAGVNEIAKAYGIAIEGDSKE